MLDYFHKNISAAFSAFSVLLAEDLLNATRKAEVLLNVY